ncbi:unnamed protein product [Brassica rapa]|uniref:DUF1639 domain-containing protein n=1 Tax=Brassica campestris TaxID=3711 RepID=A0A3P6BPV0_BRACM|nr:unnamed protein product [Brassica rapa]VDD02994.1 unnamed protein product [Brassica rapa]
MEPPPERSKRLHNFTLPYLRWGQQRFLRCVNLPSHSHHSSPSSSSPSPDHATQRSSPINGAVTTARPWNLRTRGAACGDGSPAMKRGIGEEESENNEKLKFSVSLLKAEIEEDFSFIIGKRPPRRPKKRPRIVQKKLNTIFPGMWLSEEVTIDSYNVPEAVET